MELANTTGDGPQSIGQALGKSTILVAKSNGSGPPEIPERIPKANFSQDPYSDEAQKRRAEQMESYRAAQDERRKNAPLRKRAAVFKAMVEAAGPRYAKATFAAYVATMPEQEAAKKLTMEYAADVAERVFQGKSVIWLGPCGTGKTHLMFALAAAAITAFKTVIWLNGPELWLKFRESYNTETRRKKSSYGRLDNDYDDTFDGDVGGTEADIIRALTSVDVLCIDDPAPPGAPLSDSQATNLYTIVNRRYVQMKPTFVTLNVAGRKEAESKLGTATVDRIGHDALTIVCDWPSHRAKKPEAGA